MPSLYVASQAGIQSASSIPSWSNMAFNWGVDPSPTPMMPMAGLSTTVTRPPRGPQR